MTKLRIGVFICHCGKNIAGTIDVESLASYAEKLPDVVSVKLNRYTCADPGQEEIKKEIENQNLNRIVIAACSPRMHEHTFRRCIEETGLNPYLFEMANIREHCSWCHHGYSEEATEKAKDIVKMAVAKVRLLRPLEPLEVSVTNKCLVIGGGIAGINAALDLADMGFKVFLVEKNESIGGHMAQLDKTFPTLDCSICIEGPKMVDVSRHPNITLLTFSDVISVDGYVGNFKVRIRKNPRYVLEENCTGCGECKEVCPIEYPNGWDIDMGVRKVISALFDQAVPLIYRINKDHCIECYKCVDACGNRVAIDFSQEPEEIEIKVGTIIVSTGYDTYLPSEGNIHGYGKYQDVITSLEFERLILASGPTEGEIVKSSDGKRPETVAFIQCVGSRDSNIFEYCSGFCCMHTLKHVIQLKEHYGDNMNVYVFYLDVRSNFKGYEEFYTRAREMGVVFIRGRVSKVEQDSSTKRLIVNAEDTLIGELIQIEADMVVLATASIPSKDSDIISRTLGVTRDTNGFFIESHPKLKPIDTPVDGIFLAGACQGLKDIPYSVSQGSAAASRSASILSNPTIKIDPIISVIDSDKCRNPKIKCGVCVTRCPYDAIEAPAGKPAKITSAKCHGCGTCVADCPTDAITQMHFTDAQVLSQINAALEQNAEDKILGFCCNWCSYAGADLAGTSRYSYPTNIRIVRVMCSGRVAKNFVLEAFKKGAGMVLVGACHLPYDCHYIDGNLKMKNRMTSLAKSLVRHGLTKDRFRIEYISAAEGRKFADLIEEMATKMKDIGRKTIESENQKMKPYFDSVLSRKKAFTK